MNMGIIFWILTIIVCGVFLIISLKVKDQANQSFSQYAIGGSSFPMILIFFTQFATIMGAGNFIGHAGSGYEQGIGWLAFILGEQGSKIIFALVFAGLAGHFTYNTMPEMIDDLIVRDKCTRAICGILGACIMIAWVGGQGKAFGELFQVFTNAEPIPIIILFSAIFIVYTVMGGVYSVVWTDLFQGIICLIFGALFYIFAFSKVDFSLTVLGERLADVGKAELWSFVNLDVMGTINKFLTGLVGVLVAQTYWQRCYACKTAKTARNGLLYSGIICVIMTMMTAIVGLIIMTLNQDLNAGSAMPWFMMHCTPPIIGAGIFLLILCAGMSSADSCLNSAAVLVVNDLERPFFQKTDQQLVKDAKIVTVIIGVASSVAAIYASSIISLFSKAYSMAGAGMAPLLCIGLVWKESAGETPEMGKCNSKVTPWGARCGLVTGAVVSQLSFLGNNAVLIGIAASSAVIIIVSLLTQNVPVEEMFRSEGDTRPIPKPHADDK